MVAETHSRTGLSALIPAAGLSSRMAPDFKPLLDMDGQPMIRVVIDLFHGAGIRDVVVVIGHNRELLEPVVLDAGARAVFNPDYNQGMFTSIRAGAMALNPESPGFFLLPVDIPAVRPSTIEQVRDAFWKAPELPVIPEFSGRTGHPPVIPAGIIPAIRDAGPDITLRNILFSGQTRSVAVHDKGILMDADRPAGYAEVQQQFRLRQVPHREECLSIIDAELGREEEIRAHLLIVEKTAQALALALLPALPELDLDVIRAGALLHDIKKKEPRHDQAGGAYLKALGFPKIADIAGSHMTLLNPAPDPGEKEIVYFADKVCTGDCLHLDYESRFCKKADLYPHAKERIVQRLEAARYIHARIETLTGRSVEDILK